MARFGPDGFDATKHEPTAEYEPLPEGRYLAVIVDSEIKQTRRGDGEYLELRFRVCEGEHAGRVIFARLNFKNPHPYAEWLARSELAAICRAVGVLTPKDSAELHGVPVVLEVEQTRRRDTGDLVNVVRRYLPREMDFPEERTYGEIWKTTEPLEPEIPEGGTSADGWRAPWQ